jgi:starch phosphorylase
LRQVIDMIAEGAFSPTERGLFRPIADSLLNQGDQYMLLADYASYIACQDRVGELYRDPAAWARTSILNTARMGKFSSDRTIAEYAADIWGVTPFPVEATRHSDGE